MPQYKLPLYPGDRVRNIRQHSSRQGWKGTVHAVENNRNQIRVKYDNGTCECYLKSMAHISLERVYGERLADRFSVDYSKLEERLLARPDLWASFQKGLRTGDFCVVGAVHDEVQFAPKRKTLKKVRRNVINDKTQDEMIKIIGQGDAIGIHQFNTRCTGRTSAVAMSILGAAMASPYQPCSFRNADHMASSLVNRREMLNDNLMRAMQDILHKLDWRGFTFHKGNRTVTFNPIVTEETYVEIN